MASQFIDIHTLPSGSAEEQCVSSVVWCTFSSFLICGVRTLYALGFGVFMVILLGPPAPVHAQGHFVDHGFYISAGISQRTERSTVSWNASYYFRGLLEAGLKLNRFDDPERDFVTLGLGAFAAVYPLKQSQRIPVTLRIGGMVHQLELSGDPITILEDDGLQSSGTAYRLETSISRQMRTPWQLGRQSIDLIPILNLVYHTRTLDIGVDRVTPSYLTIALDLAFELNLADYTSVMLVPRVGWLDEEPGVGLTLGWTGGLLR